jgi:hypothetical protein
MLLSRIPLFRCIPLTTNVSSSRLREDHCEERERERAVNEPNLRAAKTAADNYSPVGLSGYLPLFAFQALHEMESFPLSLSLSSSNQLRSISPLTASRSSLRTLLILLLPFNTLAILQMPNSVDKAGRVRVKKAGTE